MCCLLFLTLSAQAAAAEETAAEVAPFQPFTTSLSDGAARRYYLAPAAGPPKPLLVMVQGSGCAPVFRRNENGEPSGWIGQKELYRLSAGRYAVMVAEKPGVAPESERTGGGMAGCPETFLRRHGLQSWAAALTATIDAARAHPAVSGAPIRLLGISEGAVTAAYLARRRDDVSHIAFISGFGCNLIDDMLVVVRREWLRENAEARGEARQRGVAAAVSELENRFRAVFSGGAPADGLIAGQTPKFWSTFGVACPAEDLAASDAEVFVAYGTADEEISADGIEEITARRLIASKPLRVVRIVGGGHALETPDEPGPGANLSSVFRQALDWMQE